LIHDPVDEDDNFLRNLERTYTATRSDDPEEWYLNSLPAETSGLS